MPRGTGWLWIAALVLAIARQFEIPGVEPRGYWPRCAMVWSLTAFDLGLLIELVPRLRSRIEPMGHGRAGAGRMARPGGPSGST